MARFGPPKVRFLNGIAFPVHRPAPALARQIREQRRAFAKLLRDLSTDSTRAKRLTADEIALIQEALREALQCPLLRRELGDLQDRDAYLYALYRQHGATGARELVKALGWSPGRRGPKTPPDVLVREFLRLTGHEPYVRLRELRSTPSREPVTEVKAIKQMAKHFKYKTPAACRKALVEARAAVRARNRRRGGTPPGALRDDFPIPNATKLDRP